MRICRIKTKNGSTWGILEESSIQEITGLKNDVFSLERTGKSFLMNEAELFHPFGPGRLVGIGNNFSHAGQEQNPVIFEKRSSSLVGNRSTVKLPAGLDVWGEPEIGIVMKRPLSQSENADFDVADYVLGFCLVNDTTCLSPNGEFDVHGHEAKSREGFCQVGSFIETEFNYDEAIIKGLVNGRIYRQGRTPDARWGLKQVLKEVSDKLELKALDLIFTGCPPRVNGLRTFLKHGDQFVVAIDGLGELHTSYEETDA